MDSIRQSPAPNTARTTLTFQKLFHLRKASKDHSRPKSQQFEFDGQDEEAGIVEPRNRAAMKAFVAKLFATVSAVKAAYSEMQMSQLPYNIEAVQAADQAIVQELKSLSELKHEYLKKQIVSSPPPETFMLAEIQELQSLAKTYEVCLKKLRGEISNKESHLASLRQQLTGIAQKNKTLERKMNSSGTFSILNDVKFPDVNHKHFVVVLNYAFRSMRSFVRFLIREMNSANWDINSAALAIQSDVVFSEREHKAPVFESFVCREMLSGFNRPFFSTQTWPGEIHRRREFFFQELKKLSCVTDPIRFLKQNPNSSFGKFLQSKYAKLVHYKMEVSFSGSLKQRKMVSSGEFPETELFKAFAEMGRRIWILHCLAFSFNDEFEMFQVKQNSRFSQLYMESVTEDILSGDIRVAFTVVPGFSFKGTVVQSQVYLTTSDKT
ncbi:protein GRAVITROPIC IN THE LIGHT 1-like [Andrographis paniculata]|uniref:protein GRAVITROPIC IN THE LIGHT 1-like n=1 Tax=Andrographis paniculata TaxID=175694 RepID=UPI0021E8E66C|nr:protein GRAVITROPIC IN THE LIGHT 1-like [Andrographis paniculata]XP_051133761.1 protein GRAVITROPIC IN THE LIGHT 1-like [Andrographis paniculata]